VNAVPRTCRAETLALVQVAVETTLAVETDTDARLGATFQLAPEHDAAHCRVYYSRSGERLSLHQAQGNLRESLGLPHLFLLYPFERRGTCSGASLAV
jgi:hypothetical protein